LNNFGGKIGDGGMAAVVGVAIGCIIVYVLGGRWWRQREVANQAQ